MPSLLQKAPPTISGMARSMVGATSRADFQQAVNPNLKIVFDQQIMFKLRALQSADYFKPLGLKLSL
jgi:hypothetical protein